MNTPSLAMGAWLRGLSVLVLCGGVYTLFCTYGLADAASEAWMDQHVRNQGVRGILAYIGLVTLLTGVGVPRQLCSALGGYVFGMLPGTLWATLGTGLACCLCFSYARFLGQDWLHQRYGEKVMNFNSFLCQAPFTLTLIIRIVPLGSNFLTNFLAGVSRIPALPFLSGSIVGFSIQNLIFAMLGSGLHGNGHWQTLASAALYACSLGLGYGVFRRYKKHKSQRK